MNTKNKPTNNSTNTEINLLDTANKIALSSTNLHKKCDLIYPKPLNLKASSLKKKLPALNNLADNLTLFRIMKREKDNSYKVTTLTLYAHNNKVVISTPDLEILPESDFKTVQYKTGVSGFALVEHIPSGVYFRTSISINPDSLLDLEKEDTDGKEGTGDPPISLLRKLPEPETPLHSPILPRNIPLEIISAGKKSKEYSTPLVDLKDETTDEIYKDVITNKEVQRILESFGIGAKFKIIKVRQRNNTDRGKQPSYTVDILPLCGVDFSDLTI